jgi:3-hydroxyacyl-CoA dehydrogenase/enoyl-CoA hydratase/3-hydroxybutyryl-CoA epimerase
LGLYRYDADGKKDGVDDSVYGLLPTGGQRTQVSVDEIQQRCVLAMVNEAVRTLEDGIVRSPRDGDVAAVFGIGFPPFRGGPFRYMDSVGAARIVERLEDLNFRFAPRFAPSALLIEVARKGGKFHDV